MYPNKYYSATATSSTSNIYLGDTLLATMQYATTGGGSGTTTSTSTPAYVQSKKDSATGSATFTSAVTSGNLVVVALSIFNAAIPSNAISDNKGNTYTKAVEAIHIGAPDQNHVALFYAANVSGGSSFTVSSSLGVGSTLAIHEYSGVARTGALDKTGSNTGTSVTPASSAITASVGQELYVGAAWSEGDGNTWTAGSGYTLRETETNNNTAERIATEDAVLTTASTTFSRFTTSASNPWAAAIATFKPLVTVGGGGGGGATTTATTTHYLYTDHLNSIAVIANASGTVEQVSDYYPYGAPRIDTSTSGNIQNRKYIGQYYDNDTNLSYLNARYYNGTNGVFLSEDPVFVGNPGEQSLGNPQALNSYSYGNDNPVVNKDPDGKNAVLAFYAAVLVSISLFLTAYAGASGAGHPSGASVNALGQIVDAIGRSLAGGAANATKLGAAAVTAATMALSPTAAPMNTPVFGGTAVTTPYAITKNNSASNISDLNFSQSGKRAGTPKPSDAPSGTKPIDQTGLSKGDIHQIKKIIEAGPSDWVGKAPNGDIITGTPDGNTINHGPIQPYGR